MPKYQRVVPQNSKPNSPNPTVAVTKISAQVIGEPGVSRSYSDDFFSFTPFLAASRPSPHSFLLRVVSLASVVEPFSKKT